MESARWRDDWNDRLNGGGGGAIGRRRIQNDGGGRAVAVVTRPLGLFFADPLFDEVLCGADGVGCPADRHPPITGARRVNPFFRDLNVGAAEMLNFQQRFTAGTQNGSHYVLAHLQFGPAVDITIEKWDPLD